MGQRVLNNISGQVIMDILNYLIRKENASLKTIENCASNLGYETFYQNLFDTDIPILYVRYTPDRAPDSNLYWSFEHRTFNWNILDRVQQEIVAPIQEDISDYYLVEVSMYDVALFSQFMREVMAKLGGYVYFEETLFDADNIESLPNYQPPLRD